LLTNPVGVIETLIRMDSRLDTIIGLLENDGEEEVEE
jgi:hypothetical protein